MRRKSGSSRLILIIALLVGIRSARGMVSATARRAESSPWTGAFTFTMTENYTPFDSSYTVWISAHPKSKIASN